MVVLPKTMKAVVLTRYGKIDKVIQVVETELPRIRPNHVLIKVHSVSLNPVDWKICTGQFSKALSTKFPKIIGLDYSGTIVGIGQNVSSFEMNDKVFGFSNNEFGTYAEYISIHIKYVYKMPNHLTFEESASLPLVLETAFQGLIDICKLKKNMKVLILGGSTACGLMAIQIAKVYGCKHILVTSRQEKLCKSLGATYVVNYKKQDWDAIVMTEAYKLNSVGINEEDEKSNELKQKSLNFEKFDIIFDCIGGKLNWDKAREVLKEGSNGKYCTIVGDTTSYSEESKKSELTYGNMVTTAAKIVNRKFWQWTGKQQEYHSFLLKTKRQRFNKIVELLKNKQIKPVLDEESPYQLDQILDMFTKSMEGRAHGKLVLNIVPKAKEKMLETTGQNEILKNIQNSNNNSNNFEEKIDSNTNINSSNSDSMDLETNDTNDTNDMEIETNETNETNLSNTNESESPNQISDEFEIIDSNDIISNKSNETTNNDSNLNSNITKNENEIEILEP